MKPIDESTDTNIMEEQQEQKQERDSSSRLDLNTSLNLLKDTILELNQAIDEKLYATSKRGKRP